MITRYSIIKTHLKFKKTTLFTFFFFSQRQRIYLREYVKEHAAWTAKFLDREADILFSKWGMIYKT